jgi:hypothetical protein
LDEQALKLMAAEMSTKVNFFMAISLFIMFDQQFDGLNCH